MPPSHHLTTYETVGWLLPELTLILVAAGIYIAGAFYRNRDLWNTAAIAGLLVAGALLYAQQMTPLVGDLSAADPAVAATAGVPIASGPIIVDAFGHTLRWLALAVGLLLIVGAWHAGNPGLGSEVVGSLLLTVAGMMIVAEARDLVLLFLGLELVSIPTYVLLFLGRRDRGSAEATAKYFFLSILASALLLYGFSFLYGLAGSTWLPQLAPALAEAPATSGVWGLLTVAVALVLAGLGFRLTAVPFHFYAPDVYQGTTSLNAGFLAVVPKIAGLAALLRIAAALPVEQHMLAWQVIIVLSLVTMTVGNVSALWQTNVRRLLAFSSIAHAGYMLIGVAVALGAPGGGGVAAALFYLIVYAVAAYGSFAALAWLGSPGRDVNDLDELAGLARAQPAAAAALAIFMFSLSGIPPLAGFWGKLALFGAAIRLSTEGMSYTPATGLEVSQISSWFVLLAVVGVLNAATAAAYYLRVIATLYFRDPAEEVVPARGGWGPMVATVVSAVIVLVSGFAPNWIAVVTQRSEASLVFGAAPQALPTPAIDPPASIAPVTTTQSRLEEEAGAE